MSLVMTDIGTTIGIHEPMVPGIIIGLLGIVTLCFAYPLYSRTLEKERKRVAPRILQLSEELLQ